MAEAVEVTRDARVLDEDRPDAEAPRGEYQGAEADGVLVYRIAAPFFFGAASSVAQTLSRIGQSPRVFVLDLSAVPIADATAAHEVHSFVSNAKRAGTRVVLAGANASVRRTLAQNGVTHEVVDYAPDIASARELAAA